MTTAARRWAEDVSAGNWIAPLLHPFGQDVGSVIPEGFDAYARVFHPVVRKSGRRERWRDIALRNQRIVHPEMQFHMIDRPKGTQPIQGYSSVANYSPNDGPSWGSLPRPERRTLVELLQPATTTPDLCWFGVWEGRGWEDREGLQFPRARLQLPRREYLLFSGPIASMIPPVGRPIWDQSPNLCWPHDRAWFVTTETDYAWTYVGGSSRLIATLLSDPRLETLPATLNHKPFYNADLPNTALDGPPPRTGGGPRPHQT